MNIYFINRLAHSVVDFGVNIHACTVHYTLYNAASNGIKHQFLHYIISIDTRDCCDMSVCEEFPYKNRKFGTRLHYNSSSVYYTLE